MTGISQIVSMGYGTWGSVAGIVTLGYTPGSAPSTQPMNGWSGRPGANLRRKQRSAIELPAGIAAANDLAASNEEWDELKKANEKRMAIEAKRQGKVVASAKKAEKVVDLTPSPAPKIAKPAVK